MTEEHKVNYDPEPDIVQVVLQRVRALNPAITDEQAMQVEAAVRAEFGGMRVRIPKRKKHPTAAQRQAIVQEALNSAASDAELSDRHGVHRATLYRYVKRGVGR